MKKPRIEGFLIRLGRGYKYRGVAMTRGHTNAGYPGWVTKHGKYLEGRSLYDLVRGIDASGLGNARSATEDRLIDFMDQWEFVKANEDRWRAAYVECFDERRDVTWCGLHLYPTDAWYTPPVNSVAQVGPAFATVVPTEPCHFSGPPTPRR